MTAVAATGFMRHLESWGTQVLFTGETDPRIALDKFLAGEVRADTRIDVATTQVKTARPVLAPLTCQRSATTNCRHCWKTTRPVATYPPKLWTSVRDPLRLSSVHVNP